MTQLTVGIVALAAYLIVRQVLGGLQQLQATRLLALQAAAEQAGRAAEAVSKNLAQFGAAIPTQFHVIHEARVAPVQVDAVTAEAARLPDTILTVCEQESSEHAQEWLKTKAREFFRESANWQTVEARLLELIRGFDEA